jgi:DNA-binding NtrC family response regulator
MQQQGKPWFKGITPRVAELFKKYSWPGNVRELENVIERASLLTQGSYITIEALPQSMLRAIEATVTQTSAKPVKPAMTDISVQENASFNDAEKAIILKYLKTFDGNVKKTAESCGISRRTLYRKLEKYAIDYRHLK